jgi:hypothetical protein
MNVLFITTTRCAVCGYGNRGVLSGTGTPGMRSLRVERVWGFPMPFYCQECRHPAGADQPGTVVLDPESAAKLRAWRDRQRRRRATRKRAA